MRIFLMRARNAKKWQLIEVLGNLEIGKFCQDSRLIHLSTAVEPEDLDENQRRRQRRGRFPDRDKIESRLQHRRTRGS